MTRADMTPAELLAECERLECICQALHDRLLRGSDDRELLALAETAWTGRNGQGKGPP